MATRPVRRHPIRSAGTHLDLAQKIGTRHALMVYNVIATGAEPPEVDHMHFMALMMVGHCEDLDAAAGAQKGERRERVFPERVADLMGVPEHRAGSLMQDLARWGFLEGAKQSGYSTLDERRAPRRPKAASA